MRNDLVEALRSRRPQIRTRWRELLRADRPNTPLANPEALVHLIDWTLEEIDRALLSPAHRHRVARAGGGPTCRHACDCQRNPFLPYFGAAEQALREALVLAQVEAVELTPGERDAALDELNLALHVVAQHEIAAFCALCQHREIGAPALHGS